MGEIKINVRNDNQSNANETENQIVEIDPLSEKIAETLDREFNTIDSDGNDRYFSRKGTEMVLSETDSYENLNAANNKEREKKFKLELRKILENLAVHGSLYRDRETNELKVKEKGDLDVVVSLGLLKLAGVDTKKVEYVEPGDFVPGKKNINTGNQDGLVILDDGTVFVDHHAEFSGNHASASQYTYEILKSLEMIKNEDCEYLDNLVGFVNQVDNFNGPDDYYKNYFLESWETLAGLSKMLNFKELSDFFKFQKERAVNYEKTGDKKFDNEEIKNQIFPWKPMPETLLKKFGFLNIKKDERGRILETKGKSVSHKERVLDSQKELIKMEKEGFVVESSRYGKICLNIDGRVKCGTDAAKAFGCNTFLTWNTGDNNFFISSLDGKELTDSFGDGLNVRKTMWVNPISSERHIKLSEILNKMTDGKFEPSEAVKAFLGQDDTTENVDKEIELSLADESEPVVENVLNDLDHTDMGVLAAHIDKDINEEPPKPFDTKSQDKKKDLHIEMTGLLEGNEVALAALNERFKNFLLANSGQDLFNKDLMKRIHSFESKFLAINKRRGIKSEKKIEQLRELRLRIDAMFEEDWEGDLKKSIESQEQKELIFTDEEKVFVEKSKEVVVKFIDKSKSEFNWDDFPQKRIAMMLEIQAVALLMREFKRRDLFVDRREDVAEFIIKNIK